MLKLPVFHLQKCTMCLQKHTQNIRYVHLAEQSFLSWPELCTWRLFTFISIWWAVHVYKNNYNNNKIWVCKLFHVHIFFTYWEVRCHMLWVALHLEQITGMPSAHTPHIRGHIKIFSLSSVQWLVLLKQLYFVNFTRHSMR